MACGPGPPELSKSDSDKAGKLLALHYIPSQHAAGTAGVTHRGARLGDGGWRCVYISATACMHAGHARMASRCNQSVVAQPMNGSAGGRLHTWA